MVIRLTLLHTFVAVARATRMRDAAELLAITPGAVSQRIRELEETAGYRLFIRTRTGIELNAAGARLFASLDGAFRAIEGVDKDLTSRSSRRVTISTMGSFAANWLVPHLSGFSRQYPDIDVSIETDGRVVDLRYEPMDLAIRHGLGNYPGLNTAWLLAPELIVVASPELLRAGPPIVTPGDCLAYPLLHDTQRRDWQFWFEAQGINAPQSAKGPSFSDDHLVVRAAVSGQGLALVRDVYARDELQSGRLVQALGVSWPTSFAYYAVATPQALQRPAVRRFYDWLVMEAKKTACVT